MENRNIINVKIACYEVYNAENVNKYKSDDNMLIHARTGDDVFGTICL